MKKVALSLAGVLAAAAFAPEAAAVPAFARQVGMACSACHAQHFPILNGFGRAFKAAGFTMVGSQEKIEGEGISLPSTLNFGVLFKARYQKTNGQSNTVKNDRGQTVANATTNDGEFQIPDEYSLFFGGRVADAGMLKIGSMTEFNLATPAGSLGLRVPVVLDMDFAKFSVIPFNTDALGPFYGYTESSTGVTRGIRWAEHRKEISAHQYVGNGAGAASGIALVAHTDIGYVNVSKWSPQLFFGPAADSSVGMGATAITVAATPTLMDFAIVAGVQYTNGNADRAFDKDGNLLVPRVVTNYKSIGLDAQAHGEIAGMEAGFYAAYAKGDNNSTYGNAHATTLGADFTVIPHTLSLGAAYRLAKRASFVSGLAVATPAVGSSDNAITFTAVYDVAQNVALHADYTAYSDNQDANGDSLFTGMLEAAW